VDNDELKQLITDTAIRLRVLATEFRNARRYTMALKLERDAGVLENYSLDSEPVYYYRNLGDGSRG
jgi:hypothetical protein